MDTTTVSPQLLIGRIHDLTAAAVLCAAAVISRPLVVDSLRLRSSVWYVSCASCLLCWSFVACRQYGTVQR